MSLTIFRFQIIDDQPRLLRGVNDGEIIADGHPESDRLS